MPLEVNQRFLDAGSASLDAAAAQAAFDRVWPGRFGQRPRLILLNGMPGIGKSTLAQRYAADHPGVLNLDIDLVRSLIGGPSADNAEPARVLGLAMAEAHLRSRHDVVVPQLIARIDQLARFEGVATDAGASLVSVLLVDPERNEIERFARRGGENRWHDEAKSLVATDGGQIKLVEYADQLVQLSEQRPKMLRLVTREGKIDESLAALELLLDPPDQA